MSEAQELTPAELEWLSKRCDPERVKLAKPLGKVVRGVPLAVGTNGHGLVALVRRNALRTDFQPPDDYVCPPEKLLTHVVTRAALAAWLATPETQPPRPPVDLCGKCNGGRLPCPRGCRLGRCRGCGCGREHACGSCDGGYLDCSTCADQLELLERWAKWKPTQWRKDFAADDAPPDREGYTGNILGQCFDRELVLRFIPTGDDDLKVGMSPVYGLNSQALRIRGRDFFATVMPVEIGWRTKLGAPDLEVRPIRRAGQLPLSVEG